MADYLVGRLRKAAPEVRAQAARSGQSAAHHQPPQPIVALTAYDYFTALVAQAANADFVLVGDSLGNAVQGRASTVPVTLREMIYHTRIVCRHFPAERVVLDLPFGTFKQSVEQTVAHAVRAFQRSGCGGVKLEGADASSLAAIERLRALGVPVVAHLGLLPQRVHAEGGYRLQGKTAAQAAQLAADAQALESAGAAAIVLECVVPEVAAELTASLAIPTIGIGSGLHCDGQILVIHDVLGLLPGAPPSFVKQYANLYEQAAAAAGEYAREVRAGEFPSRGGSVTRPVEGGQEAGRVADPPLQVYGGSSR